MERAEGTDCIVRILEAYGLIPARAVAQYLEESLADTQGMAREALDPLGAAEERERARDGIPGEAIAVEWEGATHHLSPSAARAVKEAASVRLLLAVDPEGAQNAFFLPPALPPPPGQVAQAC